MLLVANVRKDKRIAGGDERLKAARGLAKLSVQRSVVPAITHVDFSARVQTVDAQRHGRYYQLVKRFKERTGCPLLINTSFNVRGEPIVCTPEEAYRCFMATTWTRWSLRTACFSKSVSPTQNLTRWTSILRSFNWTSVLCRNITIARVILSAAKYLTR